MRMMGASVSWDHERFTLDDGNNKLVTDAFVHLYNEGIIYRGEYMVNYCPKDKTVISKSEIEYREEPGFLYEIAYFVAGADKELVVATTRPETLLADQAIAVHPKDKRYKKLIGKTAILPIANRKIPIIADEMVDMDFGTGAVKITPAHDPADFETAKRHNLPLDYRVLDNDGVMMKHTGVFAGKKELEAREMMIEMLRGRGNLMKVTPHTAQVGYSERGGVRVQTIVSTQWFVDSKKLAEKVMAGWANKEFEIVPSRYGDIFEGIMGNLHEWCISRQLWWGHQIPVWYRREIADELRSRESLDTATAGDAIHVSVDPPEDEENWVRDEDVLDTWFSSWLWPFATMTNSDEDPTATLKKFYPTADLVTGPDILFFWVARMIMAGFRWQGDIPFRNVFFTSIIRDKKGRKMSKQLGNSPDPLDLMAEYGADALRFGLLRIAPTGTDVKFDTEQVVEGRNFATKIWNAARYRQMQPEPVSTVAPDPAALSIYSIEILARLDKLEKDLRLAYQDYRFNEIAQHLYEFWWSQYCDWYLEASKGDFAPDADPVQRTATLSTMDLVLKRFLLLLHPYMPHLTEELWASIGYGAGGPEFLMQTPLPRQSVLEGFDSALIKAAQTRVIAIYEAVGRARNLKAEYGLAASKAVKFIIDPLTDATFPESNVFARLAGAAEVLVSPDYVAAKGVPVALTGIGKVYLPLEGLIDVASEQERLGKELKKAEDEVKKVNAKLANENFITRANEEVVEEMKQRQKHWQNRVAELKRMISNLSA